MLKIYNKRKLDAATAIDLAAVQRWIEKYQIVRFAWVEKVIDNNYDYETKTCEKTSDIYFYLVPGHGHGTVRSISVSDTRYMPDEFKQTLYATFSEMNRICPVIQAEPPRPMAWTLGPRARFLTIPYRHPCGIVQEKTIFACFLPGFQVRCIPLLWSEAEKQLVDAKDVVGTHLLYTDDTRYNQRRYRCNMWNRTPGLKRQWSDLDESARHLPNRQLDIQAKLDTLPTPYVLRGLWTSGLRDPFSSAAFNLILARQSLVPCERPFSEHGGDTLQGRAFPCLLKHLHSKDLTELCVEYIIDYCCQPMFERNLLAYEDAFINLKPS